MKRIYISDVVHEHLKKEARAEGRTLQWVVENKLSGNTPPQKIREVKIPEIDSERVIRTTLVDDLFPPEKKSEATPLPDVEDILNSNLEQVCCKNQTRPCKHWVWDVNTGEGYRNLLSGRLMEVE